VAPIFLLTHTPIGLPVATSLERFAAMASYVLTIGQCAFVGLYGSSLRKALYDRSSQLKEAYRRIEELAELDELTGAFNRRCIMRMLEEEIARSHRVGSPCSIALIDLDHFKRINDAYGHPTGDEVLRTFAITTFANIRTIDRFGRYGGEEFLLVLPDTSEESGARMLDRLRAIIAELDWGAFSHGMRVTISAGVATLRANETSDNFLARADHALYASKAKGRNRITSATAQNHFVSGSEEGAAGPMLQDRDHELRIRRRP
jgi:diguanylate cyclase (GGDEF)-like protein